MTNITNNTHYNLTGLVEDATYCIKLVAVNAVGKSNSVEPALSDNESEQLTMHYLLCSLQLHYVAARFVYIQDEGLKCIFIVLYS